MAVTTSSKRSTRSKARRSVRAAAVEPVELVLREADHTYWVGAENIIGTTEALKTLGLFDPSWYPEAARDRGDRVHKRTAAIDLRKRKLPPILPTDQGYCESWARYKAVWRPEFILIEYPLWDPIRRVAGQLDRLAVIRRPGFPMHLGIIDLKTGSEERWHRFQISIYDLLVRAWLTGPVLRLLPTLPRTLYSIYLREDGGEPKVRVVPYEPVVESLIASAQVKRSYQR